MDSKEIDSVLVVQNEAGRQLAWDDDSGGGLNSLLTLDVLKDGTYKVYAASLKGFGNFTLKVQEAGAITRREVGPLAPKKGESPSNNVARGPEFPQGSPEGAKILNLIVMEGLKAGWPEEDRASQWENLFQG